MTILEAEGERIDSDRPSRSQSLHDMERCDRTHLISELLPLGSVPSHESQKKRCVRVEANSLDRRVLFDREARYEFVDRPGGELEPAKPNAAKEAPDDGKAARNALEQYLHGLTGVGLAPTGNVRGPETLERLRSLGYFDD